MKGLVAMFSDRFCVWTYANFGVCTLPKWNCTGLLCSWYCVPVCWICVAPITSQSDIHSQYAVMIFQIRTQLNTHRTILIDPTHADQTPLCSYLKGWRIDFTDRGLIFFFVFYCSHIIILGWLKFTIRKEKNRNWLAVCILCKGHTNMDYSIMLRHVQVSHKASLSPFFSRNVS